MPSALETLVKILKLEREQGYKDTAVIGGLTAFSENWINDAHAQARKPEHHVLVDELAELLKKYRELDSKDDRHNTVSYMLDRITRRVETPDDYEAPLPEVVQETFENIPRDVSSGEEKAQERERNSKERRLRQPETRRKDVPVEQLEMDLDLDPDALRGQSPRPDIQPPPTLARPPRQPRQPIDPQEAADIMRGLNNSVDKIKGVGPKMVTLLRRVGVETINDLLFYLPRRYDDYTLQLPIRRLKAGIVASVIGTVRHVEVRVGRSRRKDFYMMVDDGTAVLTVVFFGQHFLERVIRKGMQIVLRGETKMFGGKVQLVNPEWERLDMEDLTHPGIVPVYPLTEGLYPNQLRKIIKNTVEYWSVRLPDYMPEATLERADLADLSWTIRNLHFPESFDHLHHAKRRYIFDQLLMLQLTIMANRRTWQSVPGVPLDIGDEWLSEFLSAVFPYTLTGAQQRSIDEIRGDIAKSVPMNRLLQGDVGSGKTAVAVTSLAMAVAVGKQGALMAPTGVLAEQHYRNISKTLENMPGDQRPVVGLLTGSLTQTEKDAIYNGLADGTIDVVVGTHAIIQSGVEFKDLAVGIIDEQHRFGVEQRGALRGKGTNPHLLVMTATPIPRTLALTLYADLDLSVIDEMPPGRKPVITKVEEPVGRERVYDLIEKQLDEGRQAFIIYPLVEASEKVEAEAATENFEKLQNVFYRHRVGLLHGRMRPGEKDEIMASFAAHEFDVMVTTSVAEVGVDIPNASVILIEGANRFGLSQLHQFRGRVGRGKFESFCYLIPDNDSPEGWDRLKAMERTNDGFELARIDWEIRGPGDLVGTRQSGTALVKLVEEMSPELVALAQREARTIYEEDPELDQGENRVLAERVAMLRDDRSDVS